LKGPFVAALPRGKKKDGLLVTQKVAGERDCSAKKKHMVATPLPELWPIVEKGKKPKPPENGKNEGVASASSPLTRGKKRKK